MAHQPLRHVQVGLCRNAFLTAMASVLCVGHAVQDYVFALAQLPAASGKYRASAMQLSGGGPAATAAVAIARLGGTSYLAARVGGDPTATEIVSELERYGVHCDFVRQFPGNISSVSAVMVDERGERLIVNYLDAGLPAAADWLPEPRSLGAAAVLADSRWGEGALAALQRARHSGLPAVLDADVPVPRIDGLLRAATHVAFSADALTQYCGDSDPVRALQKVAPQIDGWSCVTVGAEGVYALAGAVHDGAAVEHFPAFRVPVVDTSGAGDVWHGAFALALAEGRDVRAAVRFASAAAALKVQRFGGRAGVPMRDELDQFLASRR